MIAQIVVDTVALALSVVPVLILWPDSNRFVQGVTFIFAAAPLFFLAAFTGGAYSTAALGRRSLSIARALRALIVSVAIVLCIAFYLKASEALSRGALAVGILSAASVMVAGRLLVDGFARHLLNYDPMQVVMICDGVPPRQSNAITMFFDTISNTAADSHDPAVRDRFAQLVSGADRVVVDCLPERRRFWVAVLRGASVQGEILADEFDELAPVGVGRHASKRTMIVTHGPLGFRDRTLKRALDLVITVPALIFLAPVFVAIALAIKLDDGGPIFFTQSRLGRDNRPFDIRKFRTMHVAAADGEGNQSTLRGDHRLTRIGGFLRSSSLDELPQFLNVLSGQMSVVGPRPHALGSTAEDQLFWEIDERYWHRHSIKPGLTGLAQVRGYRGATHAKDDLTNRLQSDLEYSSNWTIWRDVLIILRTGGVLFHRNAF